MEKTTKWNLKKPGGWDKYKEVSDKYAEEIEKVVEDTDLGADNMFKKIGNMQDKMK